MSTRVQWKTDPELSALYAAARLATGGATPDAAARDALAEPVATIGERLELAEVDAGRFWRAIVALGRAGRRDSERAERALSAAECPELAIDSLARAIAGRLTDLRVAYAEAHPKLDQQLPLRAGPLRQMWDDRGPGMLRHVARLTHEDLLPRTATLVLVQPVVGGAGEAFVDQRWAMLEAVLTNSWLEVPEPVRAAWLLARLGLARPEANKLVDAARLPAVAALALVPIVLEAGAEVEWVPDAEAALPTAFEAWDQPSGAAAIVARWWRQARSGKTPFPVAMKALDRMLLDAVGETG